MTTPSSGNPISFSDIEDEFGQSSGRSIGDYRNLWEYGALDLPLDEGVPSSGAISWSDLYSKRLNVVVDFYRGEFEERQNALTRHEGTNGEGNPGADCVGPAGVRFGNGTKTPLPNGGGKKIIIHVNKTLGSKQTTYAANEIDAVALKTGAGWASGTDLSIVVGANGAIYGAGGDGGVGREKSASGTQGHPGTAALGIQYGTNAEETKVIVQSNGRIQTGFGGGGGGGGCEAREEKRWGEGPEFHGAGGGGGGGAGYHGTFSNGGAGGEGGTTTGDEGNYSLPAEGGTRGNIGNEKAHGGLGGDGGGVKANNAIEYAAAGGEAYFTGEENENSSTGEGGAPGGGSAEAIGGAIRRTSTSIKWSFGSGHQTNRVWGEGKAGQSESPNGVG